MSWDEFLHRAVDNLERAYDSDAFKAGMKLHKTRMEVFYKERELAALREEERKLETDNLPRMRRGPRADVTEPRKSTPED
jgi:hypothetical protein